MGWPAVPQHRRSRSFPGRLLHHENIEETVNGNKSIITSVVDLLYFQCGSGFLSQCGSGSGSREPNQCGTTRIRILIRLYTYQGIKAFLKGRKPGLFDPGHQNQYRSIRIRIHNTVNYIKESGFTCCHVYTGLRPRDPVESSATFSHHTRRGHLNTE